MSHSREHANAYSSSLHSTQRDAFGDRTETTWFHFANTLQIHYLKATRQDTLRPQRALSAADLHYIHEIKLENKPTITLRDFERFWEW